MSRGAARTLFAFALVAAAANVTVFRDYGVPRGSFYDEAFYVADAQKYLHGVFFMQDHPPLGKLLVAAGERLIRANSDADDARFLSVTVAPEFPAGYSFLGYRFFPALLGWWTAPLLFLILLRIGGSRRLAVLLSAWYVFDNALIVHLRGALLEGPLVFLSVAAMLAFVRIHERGTPRVPAGTRVLFGAALALAAASKESALILGVLPLAVLWRLRGDRRGALAFAATVGVAFAIVYAAVWQTHFALAHTVNPRLPNGGYFDASPAYRAALEEGRGGSLATFPLALWNAWQYTMSWNRNLPPLDLCNPQEIGSPPYYWPLGGRTINYRSETTDGRTFRYLYLQSNPVVWWLGLAAVLAGTGLLAASLRVPRLREWPRRRLLAPFVLMYWIYLVGLSLMGRVLYLHAYFLPLLCSFVIAGILVADLDRLAGSWWSVKRRALALSGLLVPVAGAWLFFAPLTYYRPLDEAQFARRALVGIWDLRCGSCPKPDPPPGCRK